MPAEPISRVAILSALFSLPVPRIYKLLGPSRSTPSAFCVSAFPPISPLVLAEHSRLMTHSSLPECWGHRGASAAYPENTLASFEAAMRDGAEGIESDVHVSADGVVVMFHDPALDRTTNSNGLIRERDWYGQDGMQHLRTKKEPEQPIPTFAETVALLMKPENQHVRFNVDVKVQNDPDRLFRLMHVIISQQPGWETRLAPRILLGLWHPRFVAYAKARLPYCRRSHIGTSTTLAREYFWNDVEVFSIAFSTLAGSDGFNFRQECRVAGKKLMVWTVNEPEHMMECVRWGADVILTDMTKQWLDLRDALRADYNTILAQHGRWFLWTTWKFYLPGVMLYRNSKYALEKIAGSFDRFSLPEPISIEGVPV